MCGQYARIFFFFLGELKVGVRIICRVGLYAQIYGKGVRFMKHAHLTLVTRHCSK